MIKLTDLNYYISKRLTLLDTDYRLQSTRDIIMDMATVITIRYQDIVIELP